MDNNNNNNQDKKVAPQRTPEFLASMRARITPECRIPHKKLAKLREREERLRRQLAQTCDHIAALERRVKAQEERRRNADGRGLPVEAEALVIQLLAALARSRS